MKLLRFRQPNIQSTQWGWLDDERVGLIEGSPFGTFRRRQADLALSDLDLRSPIKPGKVICVGRNYAAHAEEHDADLPELPLIFLKPASSVIGAGQTILLPPQSQRVEHEAELAIIISQPGRWLSADEAKAHILGYTAANDVTARDLQRADGQWTRGKGFDTFCPLGPWIETEFDPADALINCSVNDQMRQMASTRDMVFPVNQLIAFISSVMTLEAGDVILTGTPSGVGPLQAGDEVTVEIEKIGALTNPVALDESNPR